MGSCALSASGCSLYPPWTRYKGSHVAPASSVTTHACHEQRRLRHCRGHSWTWLHQFQPTTVLLVALSPELWRVSRRSGSGSQPWNGPEWHRPVCRRVPARARSSSLGGWAAGGFVHEDVEPSPSYGRRRGPMDRSRRHMATRPAEDAVSPHGKNGMVLGHHDRFQNPCLKHY